MKFGDDWTGVFIRGDNAAGYAMALACVLDGVPDPFAPAILRGLLATLRNSNELLVDGSDTQIMRPFEEATSDPARFTKGDEG